MASKKKPSATTRKAGKKPATERGAVQAGPRQSAGEETRLFTDSQMVLAMEGWQERAAERRKAVSSTEFDTLEGATLEWLLADSTLGSAAFRGRFGHGLARVPDDDIAKIRALLRGIVTALRENDVPAIGQAAGFFDLFMGIATEQAQLARAVELVGFASKRVREDDTVPVMLVFHLTPFDKRFGKLRGIKVATAETQKAVLDHVRSVLLAVRTDNTKGGARNLGPAGALAKIMANTGAFDTKSEKSAKEKIDNALKRVRTAQAKKQL